jgi:hypothetical protein
VFRDPARHGQEGLSILVEVDPITGKISEQYPDAYPKDYPERVEKFCRNYIWRKITGDVTVESLESPQSLLAVIIVRIYFISTGTSCQPALCSQ